MGFECIHLGSPIWAVGKLPDFLVWQSCLATFKQLPQPFVDQRRLPARCAARRPQLPCFVDPVRGECAWKRRDVAGSQTTPTQTRSSRGQRQNASHANGAATFVATADDPCLAHSAGGGRVVACMAAFENGRWKLRSLRHCLSRTATRLHIQIVFTKRSNQNGSVLCGSKR